MVNCSVPAETTTATALPRFASAPASGVWARIVSTGSVEKRRSVTVSVKPTVASRSRAAGVWSPATVGTKTRERTARYARRAGQQSRQPTSTPRTTHTSHTGTSGLRSGRTRSRRPPTTMTGPVLDRVQRWGRRQATPPSPRRPRRRCHPRAGRRLRGCPRATRPSRRPSRRSLTATGHATAASARLGIAGGGGCSRSWSGCDSRRQRVAVAGRRVGHRHQTGVESIDVLERVSGVVIEQGHGFRRLVHADLVYTMMSTTLGGMYAAYVDSPLARTRTHEGSFRRICPHTTSAVPSAPPSSRSTVRWARPATSPARSVAPSRPRCSRPVGVAFKGSGFHNTDYRPQPEGGRRHRAPSAGGQLRRVRAARAAAATAE